jgi:hypothetical protein
LLRTALWGIKPLRMTGLEKTPLFLIAISGHFKVNFLKGRNLDFKI